MGCGKSALAVASAGGSPFMAQWLSLLLGTVVQDGDPPRIPGLKLGREGLKEPGVGLRDSMGPPVRLCAAPRSWADTPEPLAL